jgi:hypothetical protein
MGKWAAVLAGLIAVGEALALLIGMRLVGDRSNPWLTSRNDLFLALDIVLGAVLVVITMWWRDATASPFVIALLLVLLAAHGMRDWEVLAGVESRFCANLPLFTVNNVKIVGFLTAFADSLWRLLRS